MTFKAPKQIINWEKIAKMFARFVRIVKKPDGEPHSFIQRSQRKKIKHAANRGNDEKL